MVVNAHRPEGRGWAVPRRPGIKATPPLYKVRPPGRSIQTARGRAFICRVLSFWWSRPRASRRRAGSAFIAVLHLREAYQAALLAGQQPGLGLEARACRARAAVAQLLSQLFQLQGFGCTLGSALGGQLSVGGLRRIQLQDLGGKAGVLPDGVRMVPQGGQLLPSGEAVRRLPGFGCGQR